METIRCLVVDDEADFAEFVADALDALGHQFDICTDPTELGGIYSKQQSVIILDLFMPGMDGIEVLRFLHDNRAEVALVFMSGIREDGECQTVTRMATMLAHELGISVVAEGVEDEGTMVAVQEIGCDEVQGFHCARPMEAATFEAWLAESKYKLTDKTKGMEMTTNGH